MTTVVRPVPARAGRVGHTRISNHPPAASPNALALERIGRDYLSYSAVSTYQKCPLRFYFQYAADLPPECVSSSLVFGGAVHAAIECHFRSLFEGADPPSVDELTAVYEAAWRTNAVVPVHFGKGESAESLRDLAARMLQAFQESAAASPDGELLAVEEEFRRPVVAGCPDLLGRIDLVILTRDQLRILDFKTSRSAWNENKVEEAAPQQLLYAELIQPIAQAFPDLELQLGWVVLTKGKSPAVEQHGLRPEPAQIRRAKVVVQRVWKAIEQEHFFPSPSPLNCSSCSYSNACRHWEG